MFFGFRLTRLLKLAAAVILLLSVLPTSPSAVRVQAASGASGNPIYVLGLRQVGTLGGDYAETLTSVLASALDGRFSCTTTTTSSDIRDMLGFAKTQQLLGTPEEQQIQLQNIAAALGNVGVLISGSFGKTGDNYFVNIVATNANTGKAIDNQMVTATARSASVLIDLVEKAVSQMGLKVCRPEWTGTITVIHTYDNFLVTKLESATKMFLSYGRDTTTIQLKNGYVSEPNDLVAGLSRTVDSKMINYQLGQGEVPCWSRGFMMAFQPPDWHAAYRNDSLHRQTYSGEMSKDVSASIRILENGRYEISWDVFEAVVDLSIYEATTRSVDVCKGLPPVTEETNTKTTIQRLWNVTKIEGQIDPSRPDTLSGQREVSQPLFAGTSADGQTGRETQIVRWNLTRTGS
jgi:hypothetical protein